MRCASGFVKATPDGAVLFGVKLAGLHGTVGTNGTRNRLLRIKESTCGSTGPISELRRYALEVDVVACFVLT